MIVKGAIAEDHGIVEEGVNGVHIRVEQVYSLSEDVCGGFDSLG